MRHDPAKDIRFKRAPADVLIVVPARVSSQRFPRKLLASLLGQPLVRHTVQRALRWGRADVIVATDAPEIAAVVDDLCPVVVDTTPFDNGTSRIAAAIGRLEHRPTHIINVQGDEPCLPLDVLDAIASCLQQGAQVASACVPMTDAARFEDADVVKVVLGADGNAHYFSRAPVPWRATTWHWHAGVYGFTVEAIERYDATPTCALESVERLEQLRWLELGVPIAMAVLHQHANRPWPSVNRAPDIQHAAAHLRSRGVELTPGSAH